MKGDEKMFGPIPIPPHELLTRLVGGVKRHVSGRAWTKGENTAYTNAVKETLRDIAKTCSAKTTCHYTSAEPGMPEFLLDLVWWDDDADGATLACECEWRFARFSESKGYAKAVGEDFAKLLSFKAPLKLMIFASSEDSPEIQNLCLDEINRYLKSYKHHVSGETYLILDLAPQPEAWIATISQPEDTRPSLEPLPIEPYQHTCHPTG